MDNLINNTKNNVKFISLGYNCSIKICLKKYINQPTYLFDWIGSPMWGINKFINNNFDLSNKNNYKLLQIYSENSEYTHLQCNTQYYFRFIHDLPENNISDKTEIHRTKYGDIIKSNLFNIFLQKYERRIQRFNELLNNNNLIVFIRLEECMKNKIIHEEYKNLYAKPELEYVKEFMNLIKNKYKRLKFKLIYISRSNSTELLDNLLILNNKSIDNDINYILNDNINLIDKLIKSLI